jgi:hypothetical protein
MHIESLHNGGTRHNTHPKRGTEASLQASAIEVAYVDQYLFGGVSYHDRFPLVLHVIT